MGGSRVLKRSCSVVNNASGGNSNFHHGHRHSLSYSYFGYGKNPFILLALMFTVMSECAALCGVVTKRQEGGRVPSQLTSKVQTGKSRGLPNSHLSPFVTLIICFHHFIIL